VRRRIAARKQRILRAAHRLLQRHRRYAHRSRRGRPVRLAERIAWVGLVHVFGLQ